MRRWTSSLAVTLLVSLSVSAGQPDPKSVEFFENKIRPVLVNQCYQCHSSVAAKAKKLRGGLNLESRDSLLKGGDSGPAIVPGKSKDSHLLQALRYDGDTKMPPKGKLPASVIADFARWIDMGAPDPRGSSGTAVAKTIDIEAARRYWAFQALATGSPPLVKNTNWLKTPVDRFILARLEQKNLTPNGPVAREKLVRRAYYDLWGLPPSPAEVDAFLKDTAPDAYERLVDRLLAVEHYGERWARHWLDIVRFAESGGYEFDKDRPAAHHYRDFVIKAFNQDMPYSQFVRLQVAGDHLAANDVQAVAATGFLVAGPFPGQTTAKTQELIRYNHLDDMIATLGSSLLGLSVGCGRCHDHKYDPVPQKDYYRLLACFSRTDSADVKIDPNPKIYKKAKAEFDRTHAPFLAARDEFEKKELQARLEKWLTEARKQAPAPWLAFDLVESKGKTTFKKLDDGSLLAVGKAAKNDTYTLVFHTHQKVITGIRIEALTEGSLPKNGPGRGPNGEFVPGDITLTAASLDAKVKAKAIKVKPVTGWSGKPGQDQAALFETEGAVALAGGTVLTLTIKSQPTGYGPGRLRVSMTATPRPLKLEGNAVRQNLVELNLLMDRGKLTPQNKAGVVHWLRTLDPEMDKVYAAEERHTKSAPQPKLVTIFAADTKRGGPVYFLIRGEVDRKNGVAQPGFLQVLINSAQKDQHWLPEKSEKPPRVALADWLTDTKQGAGRLLARVIVNRLWQHHMGRGIVATSNDFGTQGEPPTHPELLDYLADRLIKGGWKLKPIHKLIMTSAVYRQGGAVNPAGMKIDPTNHLWWRRPARRLEAEAIRDALLAVSNTLDKTMYGRGSLDASSPRRSIYLTVKRSQMIPMLQMFDVPEPIQSIGERATTTVPTQSLAFMNSPIVRQRAEKFAQRLQVRAGADVAGAVEDAYVSALSRRPTAAEAERMLSFLRNQAASYGSNPAALNQALTDVCHVLLCLNEFVYVD